jgi:hypothetical protein
MTPFLMRQSCVPLFHTSATYNVNAGVQFISVTGGLVSFICSLSMSARG